MERNDKMSIKESISQLGQSVWKDFNWASSLLALAGGMIGSFIGGWDVLIRALTFFVVADFCTGLLKAWHNNSLDTKISFIGLIKKLYIFVAVAVAVQLQLIIGDNIPLREIVIFFYISNEGMSLLENSSEFIEWPEPIRKSFKQIREKSEAGDE